MKIGRITGATRYLNAPKDWDKNLDGPCDVLPIRDDLLNGASCMISAWYPNKEELLAMAEGKPMLLYVVGIAHPPVALGVEP